MQVRVSARFIKVALTGAAVGALITAVQAFVNRGDIPIWEWAIDAEPEEGSNHSFPIHLIAVLVRDVVRQIWRAVLRPLHALEHGVMHT